MTPLKKKLGGWYGSLLGSSSPLDPAEAEVVQDNDAVRKEAAENSNEAAKSVKSKEDTIDTVEKGAKKEPSEHPGEEDKFNYGLFIDVDPDRKDNMTVDVHGHVDGGDMNVTTHTATEGVGKADVHAEIHFGDDEDQDSVEMSVFDTSDSSSDQMHLRATHNKNKKSKQSRKMKQGSKSGKKS